MSLRDRLDEALQRAADVERELLDPRTVRDAKLMASLGREHQRLTAVSEAARRLLRYENELADLRELVLQLLQSVRHLGYGGESLLLPTEGCEEPRIAHGLGIQQIAFDFPLPFERLGEAVS